MIAGQYVRKTRRQDDMMTGGKVEQEDKMTGGQYDRMTR